ncbi:ATP-binding protein [Streptomyces sp. NPDC001568]|uniref:ATP-binding protein n=1 Tax=Streptomyces sp. NPDC001568 TaxID=3364588 RepID=UPI0036B708C9
MDRTQEQSDRDDPAAEPAAAPAAERTRHRTAPEGRGAGAALVPAATPPARVVTLTAGTFSLTVNPVDGSEIEPLRPGTAKGRPAKRSAAARAAHDTAGRPPALPGPPLPARPLLERAEERERLVRLLGRGRSVRLTGPAGSGRTALLDSVATACAGLAPDGVVRLSGHGHHQPGELLQALYGAVHDSGDERPDRTELLARVGEIGAIVLLDDLELGGAALDELLRATPECAYLLAATPDTKAPSDDSHLEEVFLGGLGKADCVLLLQAATGRALTEEETAWAGDLRFASEGLPLRFVQAAGLLRQRDELNRATAEDDDEEPGVFEERPRDPAHVPLPTLAEAAAPAELLASRVSESARAALRMACALGGELPHHAHLPALVGDTHADSAVAELLGCGLITEVGPRYRLAEGVARQLEEAGYGETATEEARTAARHYAWWTGHASVTPERVAAEADAVLAALAGADVVAAVLLARTAAPALAASLRWEAWERALRAGAEAARKAGEVAEQAYFHHELGVLALCEGRLDRARAELEASIGLRGALADKRGTVAGRRALALVTDREAAGAKASPPLRLEPPAPGAATVAPSPRPFAAPTPKAVTAPAPRPALPSGAAATAAAPPASASPAAALPAAPARVEASTQVIPVIRGTAPVTGPAPATLSEVFEDAFPPLTKPAPATVPVPVPTPGSERESRRKTVLLAAAGVLTVAALGTVIGLALTSGEGEDDAPVKPAVSSTPTPVATDPPTVPGTTGTDPAPEPGTTPPPAESPGPEEAPGESGDGAPHTGPTPRTTPPQRPGIPPVTPRPPVRPKPTPTPPTSPGPDPEPGTPTPTVTPTVPETPTATATTPATSPASVSASAVEGSPTATTT